ncbi:MAG: class I SAM-dependent methyltransferase [Ignavibacteria bacterium]|nr:class I SAM-dependent methyltransferase [Ignavibacteria bacterium]
MRKELINTKEAFNKIAVNYNRCDNANPLLGWMRNIVQEIYLRHIPSGSRILELNAGTGVDAIFLASKGMKVFATDISDGMIEVLKDNAYSEIKRGLIKAETKSFDEISSVKEENFDAAVSNFGGLNCINDFKELSRSLSEKLKHGGLFIAVVMNRYCPWEIFYYFLKMNFREAFRRFKRKGIYAEVGGVKVKTYYFGTRQFTSYFQKFFSIEKIYSLALFTPPPYLNKIYYKFPRICNFLMKTDKKVMEFFPFKLAGDHFVIIMRRR